MYVFVYVTLRVRVCLCLLFWLLTFAALMTFATSFHSDGQVALRCIQQTIHHPNDIYRIGNTFQIFKPRLSALVFSIHLDNFAQFSLRETRNQH